MHQVATTQATSMIGSLIDGWPWAIVAVMVAMTILTITSFRRVFNRTDLNYDSVAQSIANDQWRPDIAAFTKINGGYVVAGLIKGEKGGFLVKVMGEVVPANDADGAIQIIRERSGVSLLEMRDVSIYRK